MYVTRRFSEGGGQGSSSTRHVARKRRRAREHFDNDPKSLEDGPQSDLTDTPVSRRNSRGSLERNPFRDYNHNSPRKRPPTSPSRSSGSKSGARFVEEVEAIVDSFVSKHKHLIKLGAVDSLSSHNSDIEMIPNTEEDETTSQDEKEAAQPPSGEV